MPVEDRTLKRAARLLFCAALLADSAGVRPLIAYAGDKRVYDRRTGVWRTYSDAAEPTVEAGAVDVAASPAKAVEKALRSDPRLSGDQRQLGLDYIQRYGATLDNSDEQTRKDLLQTAKEIGDPDKDPGLALARLFERTTETTRRVETAGKVTQVVSKTDTKQVARVMNTVTGRALFTLETEDLGDKQTMKIVRRPDPADSSKEELDAIIFESVKGAATEQRVLYNRQYHDLFSQLKKLYYDQCSLVRRINNGESVIPAPECPEPNGRFDKELTNDAREKLKKLYNKNRQLFPKPMLDYLAELDGLKKSGRLEELAQKKDWKKLEEVRRIALQFYQQNQLDTYQRVVIQQLTNYFSSVTNVQPKQKKGDEQVDITAKDLAQFQKVLDDFKNGDMEGYSFLLAKLGYSKLDENDRKYITPEVMAFMSESFASVAYAARAQARLLEAKLSGQEKDAAIEEAGNWIKLAQIQIQAFDLHMQAMQLRRLADGRLANGLGLEAHDTGMIERALKLAEAAREQYLPKLAVANRDMKRNLLKQAVGTFWLTFRNASDANLWDDTERERLKLMAAKVGQMVELYLASEFEKVRDSDDYKKNFSAQQKVTAGAFRYFIDHLPGPVAAIKRDLELFKRKVDGLAQLQSVEAIRDGLQPLEPEFKRLAKAITGSDELPQPSEVQKESAALAAKTSRLTAATQSYSNNLRLFDMLNELELYVKNYASSDMVWSRSDNVFTQVAKFKWMDSAYNLGGLRENAVNASMQINPFSREAYLKLKADTHSREAMQAALRDGDFARVYDLAAKLDPDAAARARKEAKLDKLDKREGDTLDLDSLLGRQYENDAQQTAVAATAERFKLLTPLIMGYSVGSAAIDSAFTVAITAVGGPVLSWLSEGVATMAKAGQVLKAENGIRALANASNMARLLSPIKWTAGALGELLGDGYVGRVAQNTGRNFQQILDIAKTTSEGKPWVHGFKTAMTQIATPQTWKNAAKSTFGSVWIMGVVSAGMQGVEYGFTSDHSQYHSFWDAAVQGFMQGMAFGAKAGLLNHLSPMPATAFQGRFLGRFGPFMRQLANSPGPISWLVDTTAKAIPSAAKSAIGESGLLGAIQKLGMNETAGLNFLTRTGVWGLGMADGAVKYWLAAEIPKALTQAGYVASAESERKLSFTGAAIGAAAVGGFAAFGSRILGARGIVRAAVLPLALIGGLAGAISMGERLPLEKVDEKATGATSHMSVLARAKGVADNIAQLAWVLLPTNPAFSPSEIKSQQASANAYNILVSQGHALQIAMAPNDFPIPVAKPWYKRSPLEWATGAARTEMFVVNEQWRQQAWGHIFKKYTESELLAMAEAPLKEGSGQVIERGRLLEAMRTPEALEAFKKELQTNVPKPGEPFRDPSAVVDILVNGKWERVDESAPTAKARFVPGETPSDYAVEVLHPRTKEWVRVGTDGAPTARVVFGGKETQVRLTIESQAAARTELENRLKEKVALRDRVLNTPENGSFELPGGLKVAGGMLKTLRETAARIELPYVSFGSAVASTPEMLGRFWRAGFTDGKTDSESQRIGALLRAEVNAEARRLARSEKERTKEIAKQARDITATVDKIATQARELARSANPNLASDRALLGEAARLIESGEIDAARESLKKAVGEKKLGGKAGGASAGTIEQMVKELEGGLRVKSDYVLFKQIAASLDPVNGKKPDVEGVKTGLMDAIAAKRKLGEKAEGVPAKSLEIMLRGLKGGADGETADLMTMAARRVIDGKLKEVSGRQKNALEILRQALEGDAVRQAVAERGLDAAAKRDEAETARAVDLLLDIWERGVFGQLVGQRVLVKTSDGKEELQWSIPKERQFQNRFGVTIPAFRDLQREVIREGLGKIMQGHELLFAQMPTAGGKTLTNFVAIEFLSAHARRQGREGVIYLTANPDLVAQAKDDYLGFFGKKPDFEIMTVGDLSAQIAQAHSQGMPDPLQKKHVAIDEADKYAGEVPTSVGVFNGSLTMPTINPVLLALKAEVRDFIDSPGGFFQKYHKEGDGRVRENNFAELMRERKGFERDFRETVARVEARVERAFEHMKTKQFRDAIDLREAPEYLAQYGGDPKKARAEIQKQLIQEFKHSRTSGEVLYGSFAKDLELFMQGAYQFASEPERSTIGIPDKGVKGGSVISFNNGAAYSNLSTLENRAIAAYYGMTIKNPFKTAGVLNYRGLMEAAKKNGAIVFATSGTSAAPIRDVFIREFGFQFIGEVSVADPYTSRLLKPKADWIDPMGTRKFVHAGLDVRAGVIPEYVNLIKLGGDGKLQGKKPAELYAEAEQLFHELAKKAKDPSRVAMVLRPDIAEMIKAYGGKVKGFEAPDLAKLERNKAAFESGRYDQVVLVGGPNIVFKFAPTLDTGNLMKAEMSKVTKPERISTQTRPGAALQKEERQDVAVIGEKNQEALERGDAEVAELVGYAGLRGLEAYLNLYLGRSVRMDILDPHALPTEELTQLIGRLASGRAGMMRERRFEALVRPETLLASQALPQALGEVAQLLHSDKAGDAALKAAEKLFTAKSPSHGKTDFEYTLEKLVSQKQITADQLAMARALTPKDLIDAIVKRDADRSSWNGRGPAAKVDSEVWNTVLQPMLKDPNNLNANELITKISELEKLRAGLKDERVELQGLSDAAAARRLRALIEDPAVLGRPELLDVLVAAMGRIEQTLALSASGVTRQGPPRPAPRTDERQLPPAAPGGMRTPIAPTPVPIPGGL